MTEQKTHIFLFSHSIVSENLWPHGRQLARLPCPSPPPGVCSDSCPLSRWSHPTISSFVIPFCCLQSFSTSGSFPMSQLFASGGQSIGASVLSLVLLMDIQDWFPLGLTHLISFQFQESPLTPQFKALILWCSAFFMVQLSNPYMITGKTIALTRWTFVGKGQLWSS